MSRCVTLGPATSRMAVMAAAGLLAGLPAVVLAAGPEAVYIAPIGPDVAAGGSVTLTAYRCPLPASGHGFGADMAPGTDDDRCRRASVEWSLRPRKAGSLTPRRGASTTFRSEGQGRVTITAVAAGSKSSTTFEVQPEGTDGPGSQARSIALLGITPDGLVLVTLPAPGDLAGPEPPSGAVGDTAGKPGPIDVTTLSSPLLPGDDRLVGGEYDPLSHRVIGVGASGSIYAFEPALNDDEPVTTIGTVGSPMAGGTGAFDLDTRTNTLLIMGNGTTYQVNLATGTVDPGPPVSRPPDDPDAGLPPVPAALMSTTSLDGGSSGFLLFDSSTVMFAGYDPQSGQVVGFAPPTSADPSGILAFTADSSMDGLPDGTALFAQPDPASGTTTVFVVKPTSGIAIPMGTVPAHLLGMSVLDYDSSAVGPPKGDRPCQKDGLVGDFNRDGLVDQVDHDLWAKGDARADVNMDGVVDLVDQEGWKRNFGRSCR